MDIEQIGGSLSQINSMHINFLLLLLLFLLLTMLYCSGRVAAAIVEYILNGTLFSRLLNMHVYIYLFVCCMRTVYNVHHAKQTTSGEVLFALKYKMKF